MRAIVGRIVPGAAVWICGSRARGAAKPYSDLDLAIGAGLPLDLSVIAELREAFDESARRYRVDITDLRACDAMIAAAIASKSVELPPDSTQAVLCRRAPTCSAVRCLAVGRLGARRDTGRELRRKAVHS